MKILIILLIFILGLISGISICIFIPSFIRNDIQKAVEELDEANQFLDKTIPELNLLSATESVNLALKGMDLLNNQKADELRSLLIDEIGGFYYNYTYENERELNDEIIESILLKIEEKAEADSYFKKIIQYRPPE